MPSPAHLSLRTIGVRRVAIATLALLALAAVTAASAHAHAGHSHDGALVTGPPAPVGSWDGAEAASNAFQQQQFDLKLASAPLEVNGACVRTETFDGVGDGCRTTDGLLRTPLADGSSTTTHGPDFLSPTDVTPATAAPHIVAAVQNATKQDISCVDESTPHTQLVYAVGADAIDQFDERRDAFRQSYYEASAVIDKTSRSLDDSAGRRVRTNCDANGEATVLRLRLAHTSADTSFTTVQSDLFAALNASKGTQARFLVFYDGHAGDFGGIGTLYPDDRPGADNSSNIRRLVAMQDDSWGMGPDWQILLHEMSHNMGAVQDAAPDSNEVGHCNDGLDVMCYAEPDTVGVTGTYVDTACPVLEFDCGADTYFNPVPTGWLSTHWNVASPANSMLTTYPASPEALPPARDTTSDPLTAPRDVVVESRTPSSIRLSWRPSTSNGDWYYIERFNGTSWVWVGSSSIFQHTYTQTGLSANTRYRFRVQAADQDGRESAWTEVAGWTTNNGDSTPPPAPTNLRISAPTSGTTPTLTWDAAGDAVDYVVSVGTAPGVVNRMTGATHAQVTGLAYATSYTIGVAARDESGNSSSRSTVIHATGPLPDTTAPTAPGFTGTAGASTMTTVPGLQWTPATDAGSGIAGYRILVGEYATCYQHRVGATFDSTTTSGTVTGLRPGTSYCLSIEAFDRAGNATLSTTRVFTTKADTLDPTQPGALAATALSATSATLTWTASTDNAGIAGYNVYRTAPGATTLLTPTPSTATTFVATGLTASTAYSFAVEAVDVGGRTSTRAAASVTTKSGDVTPPSTPGPISVNDVTATTIGISWAASTDESGSVSYEVHRDSAGGALLGSSTGPSTTLTALTPYTDYTLVVVAKDPDGNTSAASAPATTQTADETPPTAPTQLAASARTETSFTVSWSASTDVGGSGVDRYEVWLDDVAQTPTPGTSFDVSGLSQGQTVRVRIRAYDLVGNWSASSILLVTTVDTTPPSAPESASASAVTSTSANLSWSAAVDNVAIGITYRIYRAGEPAPVATVLTTSYSLAGLAADTLYEFEVESVDAEGNVSATRTPVSFRTLEGPRPDTTAPAPPGGPGHATATDTGTVSLSWNPSTDDSGIVAHYRVLRLAELGWFLQGTTTTPSITLTSQPIGQSVTYWIEAVDPAGNLSRELHISVAIPAPPPPPPPSPTPPNPPRATLSAVAGLIATAQPSSITISWNAVGGASEYRVNATIAGMATSRVQTSTSATFTGLKPGTSATFEVSALGEGRESSVATIAAKTSRDTRRPTAPARLTAKAGPRGTLRVSFTRARDDDRIAGYELRMTTRGARPQTARLPATRTSTTIKRLRPRAAYTVQVRAIDASGNRSSWRTVRVRTR